uniref:NADH-ubiquinone oxidoreductase chain 2 n=1 Tax=Geomydoecus aurei TaxID=161607 RepID=A0A8F4REL8_9NEOP|nr:NADH dehydrogenase subunit 2 [Geomydoecus aurei]
MLVGSLNWLITWVGMEVLGFSFVCWLISFDAFNDCICKSKVWTYFIVQAVGSSIILMVMCWDHILFSEFISDSAFYSGLALVLALMMKLSLPPFHCWMFRVAESTSWLKLISMISLQKVFPMYFLSFSLGVGLSCWLVVCLGTLSSVFGIMGSAELNISRFFIYSSILNSGWIILGFSTGDFMGWGYMICYVFALMLVSSIMELAHSSKDFGSITYTFGGVKKSSYPMYSFIFISLMALPPFPGFFMKIKICSDLIFANYFWAAFLPYMSSMVMVLSYVFFTFMFSLNSPTSFGSRISYSVSMLWAFGFIFLFTIGLLKFS